MARLRRVRQREFAAILRETGPEERERRFRSREESQEEFVIPPEAIAAMGMQTFRLVCPARHYRPERIVGMAYVRRRKRGMVPRPDDPVEACVIRSPVREIPCREFPSKLLATAWLRRVAEKVPC